MSIHGHTHFHTPSYTCSHATCSYVATPTQLHVCLLTHLCSMLDHAQSGALLGSSSSPPGSAFWPLSDPLGVSLEASQDPHLPRAKATGADPALLRPPPQLWNSVRTLNPSIHPFWVFTPFHWPGRSGRCPAATRAPSLRPLTLSAGGQAPTDFATFPRAPGRASL